ncbi:MAG: hypothetical protein IPL74_02180 [Bacteroidetes bacterium]|nr:hypothetical protein [Bacteroidota bacterium]
MRTLLVFCFIFLLAPAYCPADELSETDKKVIAIKSGGDTEKLHKAITEITSYKAEQVRAFYVWIAHHISYDVPESKNPQLNPVKQEPSTVLKSSKAVCHGYSRLFQELCNKSGIPCLLVNGYTKTADQFNPAGHTWNVIFLDNSWQLIDVTWGAGGVNTSNRYVKEFSERYFLTAPELMLEDHYPLDPVWQLVSNPVPVKIWKKKNWQENFDVKANGSDYTEMRSQLMQMDEHGIRWAGAERGKQLNPDDPLTDEEFNFALVAKGNEAHKKASDIVIAYSKKPAKAGSRPTANETKESVENLQSAKVLYEEAISYYTKVKLRESRDMRVIEQNRSAAKNNIAFINQELKRLKL